MDVEKRLRRDAESLRKEAARFDSAAFLARFLQEVGQEGRPDDGSASETIIPSAPQPQGGEASDPAQEGHHESLRSFRQELERLRHEDSRGIELHPEEIRRIAELVELLEGEKAAGAWWQRAVRSGDELAIMMQKAEQL